MVSLEQARAGSGWAVFKMFFLGTGGLIGFSSMHGLGLAQQTKICIAILYCAASVYVHRFSWRILSVFAIPVGVLGMYLLLVVAVAYAALLIEASVLGDDWPHHCERAAWI